MAQTLLKVDNINVFYGNIHAVKDLSLIHIFAEAQRQDGQIVAGQAEGRDADEDAEDAGHHSAQRQTDDKRRAGGQRAVLGEEGAGISTHRCV